jgi:hypothetical protein
MNSVRKVFWFLMAMTLAGFALPAAADKVFQQTMSSTPSPLPAGGSGSVTLELNNISGDTGNANASSFKLNAPTGFTVTSVYGVGIGQSQNLVAIGGGYTATIQNKGNAVWVNNIQVPLKPFGPHLLLSGMTVNVTCSPDTNGTWGLSVWTGSNFNGNSFTLNSPAYAQYYSQFPSTTNTPASGTCANYTITPATTAPVPAGGGSVSLIFTNTSPAGGPSIGSLTITAPTNFTITGGSTTNGTISPAIPAGGSTSVTVTGAAVGPGSSLTLSLTVTTPNCAAAAAAAWSNAQVFSGSALNTGATFSLSGSYPKTAITAQTCTISFDGNGQPATTFVGAPISTNPYSNPAATALNVSVSLVINGSPAPDGTVVTLSPSAGACGISAGATAMTSGGKAQWDHQTVPVNPLEMTAGTGCTLTASGGGVGPSAQSAAFDIVGPAGTLACATGSDSSQPPTNPPLNPTSATPPPSDGQTGWALVRGTNTDGQCGDKIPYTFSCDNSTRTCQFTEDSLSQHPSIEYVILWPKVNVADDPTADKQPCVAWGITGTPNDGGDPSVCGGDFVPGLACTTDNVNGGSSVMPTIPTIPDIPGYSDKDPGLYPQYQPGQPAKVCIAQHGFTAGTGAAVGFEVYWTKIIDQSDSTIKLP